MSRIGREPVTIPAGVEVTISDANVVKVKGKLGTLEQAMPATMDIKIENGILTVARHNDEQKQRELHGLTRALIHNMVEGVTNGFSKTLEIVGVGYHAAKSGKTLTLTLGHSHDIYFEEGDGITFEIPNPNTVTVKGYDKQKVGQIAAEIRSKRPPEPYLGKGVKYQGEKIRRKAGKTGK